MIRMENHLGTIEISESYFSSLVGNAASSCFGVVGMANSNAGKASAPFSTAAAASPTRESLCVKRATALPLTYTLS